MNQKFRVNEEVKCYSIVGKLHDGIVQRAYINQFGFNVYQVLLTDCMFKVELDEDRIRKL